MRVLSALFSAALLSSVARAAFHSNDTACTRHYTVESGDTCDKIGQKTLTSTYQILAFNLLDAGADCYTLEIGSQLCLGRYGNDCQFVHQCTDQDTCESIANTYGITTQRLQNNNPSLDCNIVYDGLMLCVSAGSIRPPADRSINATDVKVAREQARQAWLLQQKAKLPEKTQNKASSKGNAKAHASGKKHHANSSSSGKTHTPHRQQHHHQHHSKASAKGDKRQAIAEPDTHHPSAQAEQGTSHQQQDSKPSKASPSSQHEEHHSSSASSPSSSPSSHEEHHASSTPPPPSSDSEPKFIDDLLTSSTGSIGSNHTPPHHQQHQEQQQHQSDTILTDPTSLADASSSSSTTLGSTSSHQQHIRHRSLSSRSQHQQRSHTP